MLCVFILYTRDVHLHNWEICDTHPRCIAIKQNIEDTYEAASDPIRFTPITMQCDSISIQHNAIRCNGKIWSFYFGSDRQQS